MSNISITTKFLRQNMSQVINQALSGNVVTITFGRGKTKKSVQLTALKQSKTITKKVKLFNFLNSLEFIESKHKLPTKWDYTDSYREAKAKILKEKNAQ